MPSEVAMTKHLFHVNAEHLLGSVGWFLVLLVARLADRGYGPQQTRADQLSGCLARRAIDAIAVVGWLIDRLSSAERSSSPVPPPAGLERRRATSSAAGQPAA
jgi:hypothetical protein